MYVHVRACIFFFQIAAWKIVLYAIVSPFFFMGLIVYYYAIWDNY